MSCTCPVCGSIVAPLDIAVDLASNTVTTQFGSAKVQPQTAELAHILLQASPQFLHKDRISVGLWGGRGCLPGEAHLLTAIRRLRRAVEGIGIVVENSHGYGYRIVLCQQEQVRAA